MTMIESIRTCLLKKYLVFSGRATRQEFWWFKLFELIGLNIIGTIIILLGAISIWFWNYYVYIFLFGIWEAYLLLPKICLVIRRFRDAGIYAGASLLIASILFSTLTIIPIISKYNNEKLFYIVLLLIAQILMIVAISKPTKPN